MMNSSIKPHGGDIYESLLAGEAEPLDFSANISPLGLPDGVRRALVEHVDDFARYPDPHCRVLTAALSKKHGIPQENIACGAGSADLIFRIARDFCSSSALVHDLHPAHALVTAPAFSEYERALKEAAIFGEKPGVLVSHYPLSYPDFNIEDDILNYIPANGVVFLCNPNNPTGVLTSRGTIQTILGACERAGTVLVLDECFIELADAPESFTAEPLLREYKNLVILKAFTKTYAMAGLRLGYALFGNTETAQRIRDTGPPWSVSVPAQIAGVQALEEKAYLEKLRVLIKMERERLKEALRCVGAEVLGGSANYIFFRMRHSHTGPSGTVAAFNPVASFAKRGILIRDCSNFRGLEDGTYFRIAVRLPEENDTFIRELNAILRESAPA